MKIVAREVVFSIIITIILFFVMSVILAFSDISDKIIKPAIIGIVSFSILITSFRLAKNKKEKGLIYGSLLSFIYMLLLYLLSIIINGNFGVSMESIFMIVIGIVCGIIGGILGVNFLK